MPKKEKTPVTVETTVVDAICKAKQIVEEIGEEYQNWYDSMPEGLQNGEKGDLASANADACCNIVSTLEEAENLLEEADLEKYKTLKIQVIKRKYGKSKLDRLEEYRILLEAVLSSLPEESDEDENFEALRSTLNDAVEEYDNLYS
jgi:hypothetical protein